MKTGVFRYVLHDDVERRLGEGWRYVVPLGEWSALMWFCNGSCDDSEIPT